MSKSSYTFSGSDYNAARDSVRLTGQLLRVWDVMKDGKRRTLGEIARLAKAPEASVSAQIRNLRKPENGGHSIDKEWIDNGLYHYWLVINNPEAAAV